MAVTAAGEAIPNPTHLDRARQGCADSSATRAAGRARTGARASGPRAGGGAARTVVARLHARVANACRDGLHQITSRLVAAYDTLVVEDLNVVGMVTNPRLARHVSDVGMGELRRQLEYKASWHQRRLAVANRWFPPRRCIPRAAW
ncbi:RNA-guided endonuclease InsQ/TnpB family protein [Haloactinospora alba]|uniref:RNA-guided endonuclease InsQ/TnpB family protein n=1 Tax=Haloactinospora alba TaxID=405555 RepID=UPI001477088B|nr:transposase [Haloactinospora alba]